MKSRIWQDNTQGALKALLMLSRIHDLFGRSFNCQNDYFCLRYPRKSIKKMFRIRFAKEEDHLVIVKFQILMAKESEELDLNPEKINNGVMAVFLDPKKGKYFVVENEKTIIASMLITYEWSDWRNQFVYWIQSVYVLPEFRGKRVFSLMYKHVKELAKKDPDCSGIRLYVDLDNIRAIDVYKAVGMNGDHYQTFEWMKSE